MNDKLIQKRYNKKIELLNLYNKKYYNDNISYYKYLITVFF